ncbi:hypothetical protein TIFTF001_006710 [Ficus carica]|uniref:2-oxoglutarate-dependent dioxygenase DAO n=1 Tax=Ficus carica TaxID=3494 RepID=A0AA88A4R6_FICCA|nr:hypothetical protein TIFTF001_006710 [Ficus carica]
MGSEAEHRIPVINFNEESFKPGSDSWVLACKYVRYGLEKFGCFEIVYDKFSSELHNSIFGAAEDFFDLPKETKMQKVSDRLGSIGYIADSPTDPLYETVGIDNTTTLQGVDHFLNIMWPAGNITFRESVHSFSKRVQGFHELVTRMVCENYGVEGLFNSVFENFVYSFRFFKYNRTQTKVGEVGLVAHTDISFISILHQHEVEGLQIKTKDDHWIDVKPKPSSFVVLAGDVLQVWSNNKVRSCEHRVIVKEDKVRYSVGLFTVAQGVIQVPDELVDDEHPLKYKPLDMAEYTRFTIEAGAAKQASRLKAFYGI